MHYIFGVFVLAVKLVLFLICLQVALGVSCNIGSSTDPDIDRIIEAKSRAKLLATRPDTVCFHDMQTQVDSDSVTLTFTCRNAFGVTETHTKTFLVD